jgi:hypothetical protein
MRVNRGAVLAALRSSAAVFALFATGCGGSVEVSELPFEKDFASCGSFSNSNEVATIDCPDGELRVLVSKPEMSAFHFVPIRFDARPHALSVAVSTRAPKLGQFWGIGCLASEQGEPAAHGYVLVVGPPYSAGILRLGSPRHQAENTEVKTLKAGAKGVPLVRQPGGKHTLRISCVEKPAGTVRIRASVDGGDPLTAVDKDGQAPFTAAFVVVLADRPITDVRFDDLSVEEPT